VTKASRFLVLGTGGREHALAWALGRERGSDNVFLHPGNAGARRAGARPLPGLSTAFDAAAVARAVREAAVDVVVIGPEQYLAEGYADVLRAEGIAVVGPGKAAANLETSKVFAKEFMRRAGVPTAGFVVVDSAEALERALPPTYPAVLKLDGLAAGKGVVVAENRDEARAFAQRVWHSTEFGPGPHRVVVEDFLPGREISYLVLCDGTTARALPTATDYKRVGEGDRGPNTGGMGAVSPSPWMTETLRDRVEASVVAPILRAFAAEHIDYRGILYIGLMVTPDGQPNVLEFNVRFGDPETQAICLRLESGFADALAYTAMGNLASAPPIRVRTEASIFVVGAAERYPATPVTGDPIEIADTASESVVTFFAGVREADGRLVTGGGRVLGHGALGADYEAARRRVYPAFEHTRWRGMHYRRDIGKF
jgi:phosphoribosylamine--glycine ligase